MSCRITNKNGHFEVYIDGKFFCSTDTMAEAVREIRNRSLH